ncbi:MAG: sigma factor [Planctomycetota bacterium]
MKNAARTPDPSDGSGPLDGPLEALLEHGDWLRQLARSLVASHADAQDLVQDTWVAAAGSPPPGGVDPRSSLTSSPLANAVTHEVSGDPREPRARLDAARRGRASRSHPGVLDEILGVSV